VTVAKRRLVFVGGGHAHLFSLKRAGELASEGAEVTVVGPQRYHYYSGMGPGLLSRIYRPEQCRVDVHGLAESQGCAFVEDRVTSVDPRSRSLGLASGRTLPYDLVSFNTGSRVPVERIPGATEHATPVKPIENVEKIRSAVLSGARRVLLLGGGPGGVELAGNLCRLAREHGLGFEVTLAEGGDRILPGLPEKAARIARASLEARGVRIAAGFRVQKLEPGLAHGGAGAEIPFDVAVLAIGIVPHPLYAESGIPTASDGALSVDDFLRSTEFPEVFGGGDCMSMAGRKLSRVGVYAVREGPVLFQNLRASLKGAALTPFRPQRRYLLILNLGDGTGLALWSRWVARGRWAFRWKNYLDTSFMAKYQLSGETAEGGSA
jgi:NADH dehydrogenase FAD-containing subunit